jgi:hypothetical protein
MFAAIGLFVAGATVSVTHGIQELLTPHPAGHFAIGYLVLSVSFVLEGISFLQSVRQARPEADSMQRDLIEHILAASDPHLAGGVRPGLRSPGRAAHRGCKPGGPAADRSLLRDAAGSIVIGVVLAVTAMVLINRNRQFLVGQEADPRVRAAAIRVLLDYPAEFISRGDGRTHRHMRRWGASGEAGRVLDASVDREDIGHASDGKDPQHLPLRRSQQQVTSGMAGEPPRAHQRCQATGVDELQAFQVDDDLTCPVGDLRESGCDTGGLCYIKLPAQAHDDLVVAFARTPDARSFHRAHESVSRLCRTAQRHGAARDAHQPGAAQGRRSPAAVPSPCTRWLPAGCAPCRRVPFGRRPGSSPTLAPPCAGPCQVQGQRQQSGSYERVEADVVTDVSAGQLNDEGDKEQERRDVPEHDASRNFRDHYVAKTAVTLPRHALLILT